MRRMNVYAAVVAIGFATAMSAWSDDVLSIQKALTDKYALTVPTADKTDIVTAGSVLVLKKPGLITTEVKVKNLYMNTYSGGKIVPKNAVASGAKKALAFGKWVPGLSTVSSAATSNGVTGQERTFVNGEKLWVTGIDVNEKGVVFTLFTDAYSDVRYGGTLTFPFAKDATPTVAGATALVAEVFDIQQSDDAKQQASSGGGQQQQQQGGPSAAPAPTAAKVEAPPPIAPPPPPPADPKSVSVGQTVDQVVANFGQPKTILNPTGKQIYVYPDMRVIFVKGKVSDVQ